MLNLSAARESRGPDCFFVVMHERAQSLLLCFITSRVQLFLRKSHSSALANGLRREDFDQVRADLLLLPHISADLIRRTGRLALPFERLVGRQDARAAEYSFRNGIAQRNVVLRAHTLHRREACHQRNPRIRRRLIGILWRCAFRDGTPHQHDDYEWMGGCWANVLGEPSQFMALDGSAARCRLRPCPLPRR